MTMNSGLIFKMEWQILVNIVKKCFNKKTLHLLFLKSTIFQILVKGEVSLLLQAALFLFARHT